MRDVNSALLLEQVTSALGAMSGVKPFLHHDDDAGLC